MSATRAHHRRAARAERRRPWHGFDHDEDIGMVIGWCSGDADVTEEAKQGTHDALIKLMGDRRTGGVRWLLYDGPGALTTIDKIIADEINEQRNKPNHVELVKHYRQIRALLCEHGGTMVVACAAGRPPES